jgi:hypothetical protein
MIWIVASNRIEFTASFSIITLPGAGVTIMFCLLRGMLGHNFSFGYIAVRNRQYSDITPLNRGGFDQHEWSRLRLSDRIAGLVSVQRNNEKIHIIFIVAIILFLSLI